MESNDMLTKFSQMEEENARYKERENKGIERELQNSVTVLEDQLADKNKVRCSLYRTELHE